MAERARECGLADVKVFWVGGTDRPWNVRSGEAWIVEPETAKLGDTLESPLRVATNSRSADISAELVDVGAGALEADYQGKDVKDKIVLASGRAGAVHALAVWKFGAAGVIAYAPQRPYFPDQVALAGLPYKSDDGKEAGFAFILTQRDAARRRRSAGAAGCAYAQRQDDARAGENRHVLQRAPPGRHGRLDPGDQSTE